MHREPNPVRCQALSILFEVSEQRGSQKYFVGSGPMCVHTDSMSEKERHSMILTDAMFAIAELSRTD